MQLHKAGQRFGAVALHGADHAVEAFLFSRIARLGKELVGIAYQFFLNADREHVATRKRQVLPVDIVYGESGACVAFADEGMFLQPFLLKDFASFNAMSDIREPARAVYIGSVAAEDAYVMKHSRLGHEVSVDFEAVAVDAFQSLVAHLDAMNHQSLVEGRAGLVVFLYYIERINRIQ